MFYSAGMQQCFDFLAGDIVRWRDRLGPVLDGLGLPARRKPTGQFVKSLISGRTRDPISLAAYHRLRACFGSASGIAAATPAAVEDIIADVTFAPNKARWLVGALRQIELERGNCDLAFLGGPPLDDAMAWLEQLPGVGRKVAASTLNASTLSRPVMIVDSHVLRILQRLGFVTEAADARTASETVTAAMPGWSGDDFLSFHIVMKYLGRTICRFDSPECAACPLAADCPSRRD